MGIGWAARRPVGPGRIVLYNQCTLVPFRLNVSGRNELQIRSGHLWTADEDRLCDLHVVSPGNLLILIDRANARKERSANEGTLRGY